jgi:hypothetical protein
MADNDINNTPPVKAVQPDPDLQTPGTEKTQTPIQPQLGQSGMHVAATTTKAYQQPPDYEALRDLIIAQKPKYPVDEINANKKSARIQALGNALGALGGIAQSYGGAPVEKTQEDDSILRAMARNRDLQNNYAKESGNYLKELENLHKEGLQDWTKNKLAENRNETQEDIANKNLGVKQGKTDHALDLEAGRNTRHAEDLDFKNRALAARQKAVDERLAKQMSQRAGTHKPYFDINDPDSPDQKIGLTEGDTHALFNAYISANPDKKDATAKLLQFNAETGDFGNQVALKDFVAAHAKEFPEILNHMRTFSKQYFPQFNLGAEAPGKNASNYPTPAPDKTATEAASDWWSKSFNPMGNNPKEGNQVSTDIKPNIRKAFQDVAGIEKANKGLTSKDMFKQLRDQGYSAIDAKQLTNQWVENKSKPLIQK